MKLISLQFAFFFNGYLTEQPDKLSVGLRDVCPIFDATPHTIPLPPDVPDNIPGLLLRSEDNTYQLNVSKGRADFFYNSKVADQEKDFSEHKTNFSKYLEILFEKFSEFIETKRLGYIVMFFEENETASKTMQSTFMKKDLGEINELNIRFNKKREAGKFELNDITKIDPGQLVTDKTDGIIISRDVNTSPEKDYKFDEFLLQEFIDEAEKSFSFSVVQEILK